jgi:hypothetical protein
VLCCVRRPSLELVLVAFAEFFGASARGDRWPFEARALRVRRPSSELVLCGVRHPSSELGACLLLTLF